MIFRLVLNLTISRSSFVLGKAKRQRILHTSAAWQPSVILRKQQMLKKKSVDVNIA